MALLVTGRASLPDSSPFSRGLAWGRRIASNGMVATAGEAEVEVAAVGLGPHPWIAHLAFAALVMLLVVGGAYHEPWFDEAQSWLIARDATPWTMVSHLMHYEGTPGLWHLLLWGLQRFGYPYRGFWLISSTLAAAGSWVILYRSPFPLWMRLGLIFSYFQAYQFAVVARSYALDALLFPLVAAAWPSRVKRPVSYALLLALLANTNAYAFLLSGLLALELAWSARDLLWRRDARTWAAALIYAVCAIAAVLQAWPAPDLNFNGASPPLKPVGAVLLFAQAFIDRVDIFAMAAPTTPSLLGGVVLTIFVIAPIGLLCARARLAALLWGGILAFLAFSALEYGKLWHSGVIFLYVVALAWMAWPARKRLPRLERGWLDGALALLLVSSVSSTALAFATDIRLPYSSSAATAALVKQLRADNPRAKVAALGFTAFNIQPSFQANVFANSYGGASKPGYIDWSSRQTLSPWPKLPELAAVLARKPDMVLMSAILNGPAFVSAAKAKGYCVTQTVTGDLIWKSYVSDHDPITVLRPCRTLAVSSHGAS